MQAGQSASAETGPFPRMRAGLGELACLAALALFFTVAIVQTIGLRFTPSLFPRIVGGIGLLLVITVIVRSLLARRRGLVTKPEEPDTFLLAPPRKRIVALAAPVAYAGLFVLFGFYASAAASTVLTPWLLGYRRPVVLILTGIAITVGLDLLFSTTLGMPVPNGIVGDFLLRRYVYLD